MSHSKRNTSLPHFTSYERGLLRSTWGSQATRLTRDSFLPFASCRLCLLPARSPVVACASNGDIFCRECAVSDLLAQRKEIKRLEKEKDTAEREREENEGRAAEAAREREVRDFEKTMMGLETRGKVGLGNGPGEERGKKRKAFQLNEVEMGRIAREGRDRARREMETEKSEASKSQLPSFWVPSLTPSTNQHSASTTENGTQDTKPLKLSPICPASSPSTKHNYSLKNLVTVTFTEELDDKTGEMVRICPSCKKGLSNGTKAMLTKPCGHVICKPCVERFMTPVDQAPNPHEPDAGDLHGRILCYVCETDLTERKGARNGEKHREKEKDKDKDKIKPGLVEISSEGTGFAGGGKNMTKREGTAFQC